MQLAAPSSRAGKDLQYDTCRAEIPWCCCICKKLYGGGVSGSECKVVVAFGDGE